MSDGLALLALALTLGAATLGGWDRASLERARTPHDR